MSEHHLNYHHLRLFWEVARSGGLRAAATRLHLTQPTISAQIKALEKSIDERLFERSGRGLKLTPAGRLMMECAGEIFSLGAEMLRTLHGHGSEKSLRLNIGITNSLPKLVAWRQIRPVVKAFPNLQLSCAEGHAEDLLGSLVAGRLDMLLSDEPAPASLPVKAFNHPLAEPPVVFCAVPALAKRLSKGFPASLKNAPMLLPASRTAWRHEIDRWLEAQHLRPRVVAEFDDAALMKTAAADGLGCVPVAATILNDVTSRYDLQAIGKAVKCGLPCYLITLERATRHPALAHIISRRGDAPRRRVPH